MNPPRETAPRRGALVRLISICLFAGLLGFLREAPMEPLTASPTRPATQSPMQPTTLCDDLRAAAVVPEECTPAGEPRRG